MKTVAVSVGIVLGAMSLSGCIVAAVPVATGGVIAAKRLTEGGATKAERRERRRAEKAARRAAKRGDPAQGATDIAALPQTGATPGQFYRGTLPPPSGAAATAPDQPSMPSGMQYLYGSGEGAANSQQAYRGLSTYLDTIRYRRPETLRQLVINDGSTLAAPYFEPCGKKPPAVVLDVDETALLNLGYEGDEATRGLKYDDARWQRWEATGAGQVTAVPGAKEALASARKAGVVVIFNSNRSAANAAANEAALNGAGLGPAKHGETLWLKGDNGGGSGKDARRWAIATGYCVVALVGDQLGDFSDLFNEGAMTPAQRRAATTAPGIADLWGNGWFMLPNPVYGSALKGGANDVFPADKRWTDPAKAPKP